MSSGSGAVELAEPRQSDGGRPLVAIGLFYALYFGALGCSYPYLNLYFQGIGLSGLQIGALTAIAPLVMPLTSVLWGQLSDSARSRLNLLALAAAGTILPMLLTPLSRSLAVLAALALVMAVFAGPIAPLADSIALEAAAGGKRSYGQLRLWGSLGYVVAAWGLGRIIERTGLRVLFYGYVVFVALGFLVALRLPARRHTWHGPGLPGLRTLLADRTLVVFLASVFFLAAAVAATESFFGIYMKGIGAGPSLVGVAVAIAALSEVPVMFVSGALTRRLGARGLYLLGFAVYVVRWLLYAAITTPQWVLPVQVLHGVSYATYFVGGVVYTNERAPKELSATAQALFSGTAYGIGNVAGALAGGYVYDRAGMAVVFRLCSLIAALTLVAFLALSAKRPRPAS